MGKALVYARYAGYGKVRAVFDMLGGNLISSIAGIFIGIFVGAAPMLVLPTVCVISVILGVVAARTIPKSTTRMRPGDLTAVACFALFTSVFLLAGAENSDPTSNKAAAAGYFALKMAGIYLTFLATVIISAVLEADIIFSLHRNNSAFQRETSLIAVFKANLYVLLLLSVVGALIALPYRLSSPNFLWIKNLS